MIPNDGDHSDGFARLSEITRDVVDRLARGELPRIEEYAVRYPDVAHLLRDAVPAFQLVTDTEESGLASRFRGTESDPLLSHQLGDFRVHRRIGCGGMGVVYEAEQLSIDRRVALKVLPLSTLLDEKAIQRFKNEAQFAAALDHPNIVPIYEVGHENGTYYYSMLLVKGLTLAEVITKLRSQSGEDLSTTVEGRRIAQFFADGQASSNDQAATPSNQEKSLIRYAANLMAQACDAVEHAHRQGVVHGDIKPANLMVNAAGKLWITDFGLAQHRDDACWGKDGNIAGTVRYMAPEQVLEQHEVIDHRVDIYALGVTLYELLTLRPLFGGENRSALIRQIAFDQPGPLRQGCPGLPVDLERIVLKTLAKNPNERYATAGEVADDLRCFLQGAPIGAQRPALLPRLRTIAGGHRTLVGTTIFVALLCLIVVAATRPAMTAGWTNTTEATNGGQRASFASSAAQPRSKQPSHDQSLNDPTGSRNGFESGLAPSIDGNGQRGAPINGPPEFPNMGVIATRLARGEEITNDERALIDNWNPPELRAGLAKSAVRFGTRLLEQGNPSQAERPLRTAVELMTVLTNQYPEVLDYNIQLATASHFLSHLDPEIIAPEERRQLRVQSIVHQRIAVRANPDHSRNWSELARHYECYSLGFGWQTNGEVPKDLQLPEELGEKIPNKLLVTSEIQHLAYGLGKTRAAELLNRRVIAAYQQEVANDQLTADQGSWLAAAQHDLASFLLGRNELREAAQLVQDAAMHQMLAVEHTPNQRRYKELLSGHYRLLRGVADRMVDAGQEDDAERIYRQLINEYGRIIDASGGAPIDRSELGATQNNLALMLLDGDTLEEVDELIRDAIANQKDALASDPEVELYQEFLSNHYVGLNRLVATLQRKGDWHAVIETYRANIEMEPDGARHYNDLAWLLAMCPEQQFRDPAKAVELARKATQLEPGEANFWNTLGVSYYRARDYPQAIQALEQSIELEPGSPGDFFFLAMACRQLELHESSADGLPLQHGAQHWYDRAVKRMEANTQEDEELNRIRAEAETLLGIVASTK